MTIRLTTGYPQNCGIQRRLWALNVFSISDGARRLKSFRLQNALSTPKARESAN
jgi:hypothetical protein